MRFKRVKPVVEVVASSLNRMLKLCRIAYLKLILMEYIHKYLFYHVSICQLSISVRDKCSSLSKEEIITVNISRPPSRSSNVDTHEMTEALVTTSISLSKTTSRASLTGMYYTISYGYRV